MEGVPGTVGGGIRGQVDKDGGQVDKDGVRGTKGDGHRADRPEKNLVVFAACSLKRESFPG